MKISSLALAIVCATAAFSQNPGTVLTGAEKTAHFQIHFRPGSKAEASVDRVAALVEDDLKRILTELGVTEFRHTIKLYLYDDVEELMKVTGVPAAGYSVPLESHVPHDNDQTRVHELVHVVAEKFTEKGPESRNLFFAEGLANAVLEFVTGVHVDAVAAFYKKRGELPTLAEVHKLDDFYSYLRAHPGFNGYDVAGSYLRYLLDTYGAPKTRKYYCGVPAKEAFGVDLNAIEKGWHARLDKVTLRPGLLALLEERADGPRAALKRSPEAKLTPAILGPAAEWKSLDKATITTPDPGKWDALGDRPWLMLSGDKSQGDWSVARFDGILVGDGMVRCTAEPLDQCYGVQIQLGTNCQAMVLKNQGAFLYGDKGAVAHDPRSQLNQSVEIVLRRRGAKASVWIDGTLVAEGDVDKNQAVLGVGCVGGRARMSKVAVRKL
jgi:hypothetical protein